MFHNIWEHLVVQMPENHEATVPVPRSGGNWEDLVSIHLKWVEWDWKEGCREECPKLKAEGDNADPPEEQPIV